jgi:hypothetical protein
MEMGLHQLQQLLLGPHLQLQLQLLRVIPRPQLQLPFLLRPLPQLLADPLRLLQLLEVHLPRQQRYPTSVTHLFLVI